MELKTYRAKTIHEALALVRRDLGPDAAVLGTREVRGTGGMLGWLRGDRLIEVTASAEVIVPSRLPRRTVSAVEITPPRFAAVSGIDLASPFKMREADHRLSQPENLATEDEIDSKYTARSSVRTLPWLLDSLIDVDTPADLARELVEQAMRSLAASNGSDSKAGRTHLLAAIGREIEVAGPILSVPRQRRLVALVGPTGVGKTTTTAKLAAHFRLREHRRVGLITVDTYRIAAVEQLRTYADIIDLPMEVVSTPHEMQQAVGRLADLDLILMDTAGRSPRDEVQIQELKSLLDEAQPDEVHLVLSCGSGTGAFASSIERFAAVGANRMILTKLDEAQGLGALLPLLRSSRLPLSYVTSGQNVPDDIEVADPARLAWQILGSREVSAA